MSKTKDEVGNRYVMLLVIRRHGSTNDGKATWECVCDCGSIKTVLGKSLRSGITTSCGCYNKELVSKLKRKYIIQNTRLYRIWNDMVDRCENENNQAFKHYGGRGISVCEEWHDTNTFFKWAMSYGYSDTLTIERINNNGNYEPTNCKWATRKEQLNNRRNNKRITINGKTQTLQQWSEELKIPRSTIQYRIDHGMSPEGAIMKIGKRKNAIK